MKVNRMVIRSDGTTELMVNNVDSALRNKLTRGWGTTEKVDSFLAPLGAVETVLCQFYVDSNIYTANDVYCKLYDDTNTVVAPQSFALCQKISKASYNAVCYQAAFEIGNGYSDNKIRYVELYHSGGSLIKYDLALTVDSIPKDLTFRKTRTNRLIVEVIGKAS
jgi:predicted oxidoreductase (fatty acid repression mutant protein)